MLIGITTSVSIPHWLGFFPPKARLSPLTNQTTGGLEQKDVVNQNDYVNISEVPNVRLFPLGTDNFGRDVLTELVTATERIPDHRVCGGDRCDLYRPDSWVGIRVCRRFC